MKAVADPDIQISGGRGAGHPDHEIRGSWSPKPTPYSTMKSTDVLSWQPMKKTPVQHFRITISDMTDLEAFTDCK